MKLFFIFMLYYYICSILCAIALWKKLHKKENKEKLENDLARFIIDVKGSYNNNFTREDALIAYYLAGIFFSFIIVPISILNKLLGFAGKKNA